jgi:hypothetical protein
MTDTEAVTVHNALIAVMRDVTKIGKGGRNNFYNFSFRGVEQVMDHIGPAFRKHGIVPTPHLQSLESRDVTTKKGETMREVTVIVRYEFEGPSGDKTSCTVPGEAQDAGASAVSKAMSVAQRIAYTQALAIPTGEADPEALAAFERAAADPLTVLKHAIWTEGKKREWILPDDTYVALSDDFAHWSQGEMEIEHADEEALKRYLDYLRPAKRMQRGKGAS